MLLGAPAVGKTSIVQQFVWNEFYQEYAPTEGKTTYYPSVVTNDRLYEITISDLPVIPYFPINSYYEWANYRYYGLRSATAYILVFDLSNIETFQYIRNIRDQMHESRNMQNVPILVVGNKHDLIAPEEEHYPQEVSEVSDTFHGPKLLSDALKLHKSSKIQHLYNEKHVPPRDVLRTINNALALFSCAKFLGRMGMLIRILEQFKVRKNVLYTLECILMPYVLSLRERATAPFFADNRVIQNTYRSPFVVGNTSKSSEEKRRDIVNLVKKHWKSGYIECSAKYNWKVVAVFRELVNMVDNLSSREQSPMLDNLHETLDRNKCVVI